MKLLWNEVPLRVSVALGTWDAQERVPGYLKAKVAMPIFDTASSKCIALI